MPLVGVKPFGASWIDNCSYFELDYATKPANIRSIQIDEQFLTSFTTGMGSWPTLGPLTSVPNGALEVVAVVWKIRFPPTYYCTYN